MPLITWTGRRLVPSAGVPAIPAPRTRTLGMLATELLTDVELHRWGSILLRAARVELRCTASVVPTVRIPTGSLPLRVAPNGFLGRLRKAGKDR